MEILNQSRGSVPDTDFAHELDSGPDWVQVVLAETTQEYYCPLPKNSEGQRQGMWRYTDPACMKLLECLRKVWVMKYHFVEWALCSLHGPYKSVHMSITNLAVLRSFGSLWQFFPGCVDLKICWLELLSLVCHGTLSWHQTYNWFIVVMLSWPAFSVYPHSLPFLLTD